MGVRGVLMHVKRGVDLVVLRRVMEVPNVAGSVFCAKPIELTQTPGKGM